MKCSDCRLWETEGCINPEKKDLDYAETFICFDLKEGLIDYRKEALKARNRALVTLIIGLVLIPIAAFFFLAAADTLNRSPGNEAAFIAFVVAIGIAGLASLILLLAALIFFDQYLDLKGRIKNPKRKGS